VLNVGKAIPTSAKAPATCASGNSSACNATACEAWKQSYDAKEKSTLKMLQISRGELVLDVNVRKNMASVVVLGILESFATFSVISA